MHSLALGKDLRSQFPIFENNKMVKNGKTYPLAYLDTAVSSQKPRQVIDAMTRHMTHSYGSVHRGAYQLSIRSSQIYEETRAKVAAFVGPSCRPSQIVFTKGSTESLNMVARGLADVLLQENDRIVVPASEHHANLIPWQQAALRTNCEIAYLNFHGTKGHDLRINLDEAARLITPNTRVVALAHMGNAIGQINPIEPLIALAKAQDAFVIIDSSQSMSCLETDLFALGADAVAFSSHKIYGPSGIGILALSPRLARILPPFLYGGGMVSAVSLAESRFLEGPSKFEAGTPPITEVVGLHAAIDWLETMGRTRIHDHAKHIAGLFLKELQSLDDIEVFSPQTGEETIVAFRHKRIHAHDLATILDHHNVAMRAGHHCAWPLMHFLGVDALVRASFGAYSDTDDVDSAIEALKTASQMF